MMSYDVYGACGANCRAPGSWLLHDHIPVPDWVDWPEPNLDCPAGTRPFLDSTSTAFCVQALAAPSDLLAAPWAPLRRTLCNMLGFASMIDASLLC